ncbi:hypothetical protein EXIGLDRAFT_69408 [Exidia glandulosa HHB12029]|uniref:Aminoglycoside phosphotransferase domain-containing protein n=1 Tax=Exidia glandulosa HHB12029 TaxID=1314781 RepID=A0A166AK02_EXIGL|nr:hypothetical protein EXIGLDRAFT_69408 [Exidia glandulosa HHB12029]
MRHVRVGSAMNCNFTHAEFIDDHEQTLDTMIMHSRLVHRARYPPVVVHVSQRARMATMPTRPHVMPRQHRPRTTSHLPRVPTESEVFKEAQSNISDDDKPIGIDTDLLVDVASHPLGIGEVPEITLAYEGTCNAAFLLHYSTLGRSVAVRFPLQWVRNALRVESAAATMSFTRHVLRLPVPEVFAWNATYDNPLGVPYLFLEYVSHCREAWDRVHDQPEEEGPFVRALARCHAALARPLPTSVNWRFLLPSDVMSSPLI